MGVTAPSRSHNSREHGLPTAPPPPFVWPPPPPPPPSPPPPSPPPPPATIPPPPKPLLPLRGLTAIGDIGDAGGVLPSTILDVELELLPDDDARPSTLGVHGPAPGTRPVLSPPSPPPPPQPRPSPSPPSPSKLLGDAKGEPSVNKMDDISSCCAPSPLPLGDIWSSIANDMGGSSSGGRVCGARKRGAGRQGVYGVRVWWAQVGKDRQGWREPRGLGVVYW